MRKNVVPLLVLVLAFILGSCSSGNEQAKNNSKQGDNPAKAAKVAPGKQGTQSMGAKIDIDKLDIPDRMKQAIKDGKIPMDRVREFMQRRRGNQPNVRIERIKKQPINSFLILNGVVEPERQVEIFARLSAYVKNIVREEGEFIKRNDVLALLDDSEIKISYQQAKIQLKQAEITLKDEERNHQRNKKLKETELISEKDFLASQLSSRKAKLDYENKNEDYKNLQLQLNYTRIRSPISGYITERLIEVGDKVNNNQQVYTVEDFSPLLVKVFVPTADIVNLKEGMPSQITTDVLKGMVFKGKIKLINPRIDVQSGTVKVTLEVYDKQLKLRPGMFVETKIMVRSNPEALVIPKKSIVYKRGISYVFIFNKMKVQQREVKTGISEGDNIEILSGIKEGEALVTVGVETLKDQMQVNVIR
jgi:RND family efflux transporter MFP subunit